MCSAESVVSGSEQLIKVMRTKFSIDAKFTSEVLAVRISVFGELIQLPIF